MINKDLNSRLDKLEKNVFIIMSNLELILEILNIKKNQDDDEFLLDEVLDEAAKTLNFKNLRAAIKKRK